MLSGTTSAPRRSSSPPPWRKNIQDLVAASQSKPLSPRTNFVTDFCTKNPDSACFPLSIAFILGKLDKAEESLPLLTTLLQAHSTRQNEKPYLPQSLWAELGILHERISDSSGELDLQSQDEWKERILQTGAFLFLIEGSVKMQVFKHAIGVRMVSEEQYTILDSKANLPIQTLSSESLRNHIYLYFNQCNHGSLRCIRYDSDHIFSEIHPTPPRITSSPSVIAAQLSQILDNIV